MFLGPSFKMTSSFANIILYTRKDFKSSGIGSLYEKWFLILKELRTSLMLKYYLRKFRKFIFNMVRKVETKKLF